jgi:hypothetical protein
MSNALAIASVTAVLKDLLDNAVIDHSLSTVVGDRVTITALPPDRIRAGGNEIVQLNLFLYNIAPNPGWRNAGLPSRNNEGQRLTNPPLAIDLYYLLSAYGREDFEGEILLGYAMQTLHEMPVLTRDAIRKALEPVSPVDGSSLPEGMKDLSASDLAEQVEMIKITPHTISTEEISKLWSAFQANYRPSVAYHVSVVLIESKYQTRSPLPVLSRGRPDISTGHDEGVITQPDLLPPFPTIQEVKPPDQQPAIRMGERLIVSGHHLGGDQAAVLLTHVRSSNTLELPVSSGATSTEFQVVLPDDPASGPVDPESPMNPDNWQAGIYSISGVIRRTDQPDRTTNELSIALAPLINSISVSVIDGTVELTVTCSPKVWKNQIVTLVVGDREITAEPVIPDKTDTLVFRSDSLLSGAQWVRLRVDGIESILIDRSDPVPVFNPSDQVDIP